MKIIIYGSQYGTAKQYAEELSKKTNIKIETYENIKNIDEYETIIYIGALYAGGVLGMAKTFKKISNCESKKNNNCDSRIIRSYGCRKYK